MKAFGPAGASCHCRGLASWQLVFILLGLAGLFVVPALLGVRERSVWATMAVRPKQLCGHGIAARIQDQVGRDLRTIIGFALISLGATTVNAWGATLFFRTQVEHWRCRPALGRTHAAPGALGCHKRRCRGRLARKRGRSTLSRSLVSCQRAMRRCGLVLTLQSTTLALLGVGL